MIHARVLPLLATMLSIVSFGVLHPVDSFRNHSPVTVRNIIHTSKPMDFATEISPRSTCSQQEQWMALKSAQEDNESESGSKNTVVDAGSILGIAASLVVLYSEFVLKTTGCGLPAGPFGLVGAVEGVSYLGVVGICATAASAYFVEDDTNENENAARKLATILGVSAAVVGITVLAFQVAEYGYIPNAVPMEGGMCK